jgi:hypothetical protein
VEQVKLECENIKWRKEILKQGFKHLVTHTAFEHARRSQREQNKEKIPWLPQSIIAKPLVDSTKKVKLINRLPRSFLRTLINPLIMIRPMISSLIRMR